MFQSIKQKFSFCHCRIFIIASCL